MGRFINTSVLAKIWQILSPDERRHSIVIFLLMLVGMVLETLGIGLVIPALALMTQANIGEAFPPLAAWLDRFGNPSNQQVVMAGMFVLVAAYAVKTAFLAFLTWRQMKFIFSVQLHLSERLFAGYLSRPYCFHLQRNSSELVRNITHEATLFSQNGFLSAMLLLTEFLVIFGISALLLCIEPVGALVVVSSLGAVAWCANAFLRKHTIKWGERRQLHEESRLRYLMEGLSGVKEVKMFGCEDDFVGRFQSHSEEWARVGRRQATLLLLPRLILELFAVTAIAGLVLTMLLQGRSPESLLPTLGVFAAAAFRIMPSFSRIMTALQSLQYVLPVVDTLHSELHSLEEPVLDGRESALVFEKSIAMDRVGFQYATAASSSLDSISLSIAKGSTVGFIGGSGAGKSTLVDILIGLLEPSSGTVKVDSQNILFVTAEWQKKIGYVPQTIFLKDDSLRLNIAFGIPEEKISGEALDHAIKSARLDDFVKELPDGLETKVGERGVRLSGGQRQRIGIARALYHNPEVLVLDEATSALDVKTESEVMEAVNALHGQKTIIIVAHRMSTVERCDRLFRLEAGRLVSEGTPLQILRGGYGKPAEQEKAGVS